MPHPDKKVLSLVWQHMSIYLGHMDHLKWHKLAVPAFIVGLEHSVSVSYSRGKSPVSVRSAFLPAGYLHATDYGGGLIAAILLDPLSDQCSEIKNLMRQNEQGFYVDFKHQNKMISELRSLYYSPQTLDDAQQRFNLLLTGALGKPSSLLTESRAFQALDSRLQKVIDAIRTELRGTSSIDDLAANVALSKVHLERLFKQHVGVPIGKYQQWLKLFETVRLVMEGRSFSESAELMGFNDVAHYSKLFKTVVGVSPTNMFPEKQLQGDSDSKYVSVIQR